MIQHLAKHPEAEDSGRVSMWFVKQKTCIDVAFFVFCGSNMTNLTREIPDVFES